MERLKKYKGKRVLVTGHTGFKGTWMCQVLNMLGAEVIGYSLKPLTKPNLFDLCDMEKKIDSVYGDIRDLIKIKEVFESKKPEIVIHMAAQPLVRESYINPVYTYETNVMGTVNVLECIRKTESVKSFLNVTTDKVYLNREWEWGYRENEELNGYDPYSNSKSCSELVTSSFKKSFFYDKSIAISTARAGNVIGGGDFAKDRIIPDCIRAIENKEQIIVRNPFSVRPYEHVLDPIIAYLIIAITQYEDESISGCYNIGPDEVDCLNTGELVTLLCEKWEKMAGEKVSWVKQYDGGPHEANFLKLDCSKAKMRLNWKPRWNIHITIEKIVEWTYEYLKNEDINKIMQKQIDEFLGF